MENVENPDGQTAPNEPVPVKPAPVRFMLTMLGDLAVVTPEEYARFSRKKKPGSELDTPVTD